MQRFHTSPRPQTLRDKVNEHLELQRFRPPGSGRIQLKVADHLGMDHDARTALARLLAQAERRKVAVAGRFMPDRGVSAMLSHAGITEEVAETDFGRYEVIAVPYSGIARIRKERWEKAGHPIEDFTSPQIRRAQVALGLLRMEGAQSLVIGRHEDSETSAIAGIHPAARIIEDTTDTARLPFSPAFGAVCHTQLSPIRVAWLVQQLRLRYRDARVTFLDTGSASTKLRLDAFKSALGNGDHALIVGDPGETSTEALRETALRHGCSADVIPTAQEIPWPSLSQRRLILTAGAFASDTAIHEVAQAITCTCNT